MCSSRPTPIGIVLESNNSADSFFTRLEFGVPLKLMRKPLSGEPCCVRYHWYHRSPAPFHFGPFIWWFFWDIVRYSRWTSETLWLLPPSRRSLGKLVIETLQQGPGAKTSAISKGMEEVRQKLHLRYFSPLEDHFGMSFAWFKFNIKSIWNLDEIRYVCQDVHYIPFFIKPEFGDLNSRNLTCPHGKLYSSPGSGNHRQSSGFWLIAPSGCEVIGLVLSTHAAATKFIFWLYLCLSIAHSWNILVPEAWF